MLDEDGRRRAGESIADVMAEIHAVDVDAVGLGELGKKEGYIARQLKRWYSQFQQSNELTQRPVPLVHEVHDTLAARIPPQEGASIVHGDYRLDNCMLGDDGRIAAVLDWEICTLGDPLADVGSADGVLEPAGRSARDAAHRADDGAGLPDSCGPARALRRQVRP